MPPEGNAVIPLALLFATLTVVTTLSAAGVPFLSAVATGDTSGITGDAIAQAAPGAIATCAVLGVLCCHCHRSHALGRCIVLCSPRGVLVRIRQAAHCLRMAHP